MENNSQPLDRPFSLLWPPDVLVSKASERNQLGPDAVRDLELDALLPVFSDNREHRDEIRKILITLVEDEAVIRYRQEVLDDLLANPRLVARLTDLLPTIDSLARFSFRSVDSQTTLQEVTWRMGELQGIVDSIQGLGEVLEQSDLRLTSQGLTGLKGVVEGLRSAPDFQNLVRELPDIMTGLRSSASVTIGVNLDQFLRPVEATLLSVNQKKFTRQSLMNRLFNQGEFSGIAPLHEVPRRQVEGRYAFSVDPELGRAADPLMVPLFKDLSDVLEKTTKPIAEHLKQYNRLRSRIFVNLRQDLIFYLGVLNFIRRMRASGLPVCRPETADMEERLCSLQNMYNPNLALNLSGSRAAPRDLAQEVVRNDAEMGAHGRIHILTGPNRGGKTTFMQGLALIQVMFQCGMYVPAAAARISPVDQVYTHFPIEERLSNNTGRFGDEARRLAAIFQQVTRFSLVLLNESFTSTSAGESQYLAEDVLRIFRRVGARVIFSTHMHELAGRAEELNQSTHGESQIVSLVSSPVEDEQAGDGIRRNYKIFRRPPMGRSYAREIAERYGIGYEQLEELLEGRGVLKHEPPDALS